MKRKMIKSTILFILLALSSSLTLLGGEPKEGDFGFRFLAITPDARSYSLGNTVAIGDQWNSGYWNPAAIGFAKNMSLQYDHANYYYGYSNHNWTAGYAHSKFGSLALTFRRFDFGSVEKTTEEFPDGGIGSYKLYDDVIALNYAYTVFNVVSFGATIKRFSSQIDKISASATLLDLGVMARIPMAQILSCNNTLYMGASAGNNLMGSNPKYHGDGMSRIVVIDSGSGEVAFLRYGSEPFLVMRNYRMGIGYGINYTNKNILGGNAKVVNVIGHLSYEDFSSTNIFVSDHSYKSHRNELIFGMEISVLEIAFVRFSSKNFIRGDGKVWGEKFGYGFQLPIGLFIKAPYEITPKYEYSEQRGRLQGEKVSRWSFGLDVKL